MTLLADLVTVEDARRMAAVLPKAAFHYAGARTDHVDKRGVAPRRELAACLGSTVLGEAQHGR
ncbi:hypothetical protein [Streptomyces sp. NPDC006527]|uniref:hypothetical protein n=1 Tax=Streptomyces sp. NPDC006527 TaxID=3364749 RepID=UPI0036A93140